VYRVLVHKKVEKFLDSKDDKFVLSFWDKIKILKKNPFDRNNNIDVGEGKRGQSRINTDLDHLISLLLGSIGIFMVPPSLRAEFYNAVVKEFRG
jgi:hypothetical protein